MIVPRLYEPCMCRKPVTGREGEAPAEPQTLPARHFIRRGPKNSGHPKMLEVIVEPEPRPGADNMAIDESLLVSAIDRQTQTLRIYRWSEPTVSLGYFQKEDDPD